MKDKKEKKNLGPNKALFGLVGEAGHHRHGWNDGGGGWNDDGVVEMVVVVVVVEVDDV